jgi:hypothetical protein
MSNKRKHNEPKRRSAITEFMILNLKGGPMRDRRFRREKAKSKDYRNSENW